MAEAKKVTITEVREVEVTLPQQEAEIVADLIQNLDVRTVEMWGVWDLKNALTG